MSGNICSFILDLALNSSLTGRTQTSFCIFISVTAETHKTAGNNAFLKDDFVTAINLYTEGIEVKCKDEDLKAKLYNNRASAHYHLGEVSFILTQSVLEHCIKFMCLSRFNSCIHLPVPPIHSSLHSQGIL